jgi:hypothetical protein
MTTLTARAAAVAGVLAVTASVAGPAALTSWAGLVLFAYLVVAAAYLVHTHRAGR